MRSKTMSWHEEDMYPYARKNLQARFPARNGWQIFVKDRWSGGKSSTYEADIVVERKRGGKTQRIVVEVKVTGKVTKNHINQINRYCRNLSGATSVIAGRALVVPSGADVSIVPDYIEIMFLRAFKWNGEGFDWQH
jgi:hypothetical protein